MSRELILPTVVNQSIVALMLANSTLVEGSLEHGQTQMHIGADVSNIKWEVKEVTKCSIRYDLMTTFCGFDGLR